jgi:hypothetical protein
LTLSAIGQGAEDPVFRELIDHRRTARSEGRFIDILALGPPAFIG